MEAGDGHLAVRRQGLHAQSLNEPTQHLAHERGEPDVGEAVVERLVCDRDAVLVIKGPEQIGERLHVRTRERRDDREK